MCKSCSPISRRSFIKYTVGLGATALIGGFELVGAPSALAAPAVIGTATWGAQPPTQPITILAARPTKIIVHHTAGVNTTDYSLSHAYSLARQIQQDHFARGWIDTGQHYTISRGGYALEGRHRSLEVLQGGVSHVQGAHCTGQNDVAVGIENEGTYTLVQPPQALYNQLVAMCSYICRQYNISSAAIYGHRDFNATECPGDQLYAMLPRLRSDVAAHLSDWPVMRRGQSGENVKTVQYLLQAHSYTLTVDGIFGSGTEGVVGTFQASRGLAADGIVDYQTWEALIITVSNGSSGPAVSAVQSQLVSKGYSLTIDGVFGTQTQNAVKSFQTSKGLTSDGIVGLNTWKALV